MAVHVRWIGVLALLAACSSGPDAIATTTSVSVTVTTSMTAAPTTTTTTTTTTTATTTTTTAAATTTVAPPASAVLRDAYLLVLDSARLASERAESGRQIQRTIRNLALDDERIAEIVSAMPSRVAPLALNDLTAALAPSKLPQATPLIELPAWLIRDPLPAAELVGYYRAAGAATGIPWETLAAINLVETRMGRIVGLSSAGAIGPMQFLPTTWSACCDGDPWVDRDAIFGAATYLVRRGGPTDMRRAILGYNPSEPYLAMVTAYADNLRREPELYVGYHAWEVYVRTPAGALRLPVGFTADAPVDALEYYRTHPNDRA